MILENKRVRLEIDDSTGGIAALGDKELGREYIVPGQASAPFRVVGKGEAAEVGYAFSAESRKEGLSLSWKLNGAALRADVSLLQDGVSFRASLANGASACVKAFEYPILGGLRDYGDQGYLAHSYATGVVFQNPLSYMQETGGLRYTPYPEAFSGASMQFFTYYEQGKGGLYFAALDGEGHQKWLNVFKEGNHLAASHMAGFENVVPSSVIAMDYDFVIRFTAGQGWEEAAELYKAWGFKQPWCARGLARERKREAAWLREKVGMCTFGINAGHERTRWLRRYHADIGTPIFHVLGPDWTNREQNFYNSVPGSMEDWLPTRFNPENLRTIRENGDFFAPFEFDFLVGLDKSDPGTLTANLQEYPKPSLSHDGYTFHMLCPCTGFTKDFHARRDVQVLKEAQVDAMYYDISANNLIKVCLSGDHGHAPGGGHEITEGYRAVYKGTREALAKEAGKYIPLGTEMMNEVFLGELDFYQARAWGQPCSTLETWPFREQMHSGLARMIPLFDYVYHEMGVVRMDGWGKLVDEIGDLFYYNVAKVYLWGGLYELNHEYSPMEELDGQENSGGEHYFHFDPQHCAYAPHRAAYVSAFAKARVGAANPYWAYGKMTVRPQLDIPMMEADWYHYNHGQKDPSYKARGTARVEAVVSSAYEDGQGGYALFLANADEKAHPLTFSLDHKFLRLSGGDKTVCLTSGLGRAPQTMDLGMLRAGEALPVFLEVPPRTLCMLEIK